MISIEKRKQNTLLKSISYSGVGLHTGSAAQITLHPAAENFGIQFCRVDLPERPFIPAHLDFVKSTSRSTNIASGEAWVHTIEHLLAALKAYSIDNLLIDISSVEVPIISGNSEKFVEMIEEAGISQQDAETSIYFIDKPIYWSQGDISIVAIPCSHFKVSYTLHYPKSKVLNCQYYSGIITPENFKQEIAPCRSFALYEELQYLLEHNLIKGASLDTGVVIKGDAFLSKDGLKFPNEMVRHKVLDLIGDLSLTGLDFRAHIISIRSGHPSHFEFAKNIFNYITMEKQ